ncbi:FixH family protein [Flavobacterium sp. Fl-77]|uniref:FixH family protein n=1 Tax=Flavobacterium flavipigmentatum TaxID=2893884 RepID=A0AAJ2VX44_9FLAO|nr:MULTISPECIES: FixH family protein [unclassified Flavobacterium]MDX6183054.1 FixH family protein [Flavobacterium sp. Fl-33]MDX6186507.1 FixH family protein [Flavobacterium sp. Fl-77]UFH37709.1 FixH family protein [Flavobacterium sp. F-70]
MKSYKFLVIALFCVITSCTIDKTDYQAEIGSEVPEYYEFKEAVSLSSGNYKISIEALNGTFFKGYNELHLKIINIQTNQDVSSSEVTFLPILSAADGSKTSCPHNYNLQYVPTNKYFAGYCVFTSESTKANSWKLYVNFTANNQKYDISKDISVEKQSNKNLNMTAFTGKDDKQYVIALVSPQKPKVSENKLVAGIYKYNKPTAPAGVFPDPSQYSYSQVRGYTLKLDPRMPEPSMGNHSSPNNQDLTQQNDGLYHGVVNYTMTGNWTLNLIMINQNGLILKGTVVPTDFTPGEEGVKSELYIDTLF